MDNDSIWGEGGGSPKKAVQTRRERQRLWNSKYFIFKIHLFNIMTLAVREKE
jgi:hypothetical protein